MMKSKKIYLLSVFLLLVMVIVIDACKKDEPLPHNPYDDVDYGNNAVTDTIDPNSFVGLHKNIFSVKCANPGCHDGNFEPDFRTVQSAYATLVYHPVVKKLAPWEYRVLPNDTAKSWLWQRLNHSLIVSGEDTCQGRMPLYSTPLSQQELNHVSNWIMSGAKDIFNQAPQLPNSEPLVIGYLAFNPTYSARYDTIRENDVFYNSFIMDTAIAVNIVVAVTDDSTAVSDLIHNKLKFSLNADDFTNAQVIDGTYLAVDSYKFWLFTFNTNMFSPNDVIFMRYYTNDGDHATDTELPRTDMSYPWKTFWSFKLVPQ